MIYANNEVGKLTQVLYSGQKCLCPICKGEVFGKIYLDKQNHFAHKHNPSCSYYTGSISDWHINWQSKFENIEVRYPEKGLRADVVMPKKTVIEFQNSRITFEEIKRREKGYKKMIWLFNLSKFDSDKVYVINNQLHWNGFIKNWVLPTKPFFYHLSNNTIVQIKDPIIETLENKGGYPIYNLITKFWKVFSIDEWLQMCYDLDKIEVDNFEISENIRYKNLDHTKHLNNETT